jgi:hypothetical protein
MNVVLGADLQWSLSTATKSSNLILHPNHCLTLMPNLILKTVFMNLYTIANVYITADLSKGMYVI